MFLQYDITDYMCTWKELTHSVSSKVILRNGKDAVNMLRKNLQLSKVLQDALLRYHSLPDQYTWK